MIRARLATVLAVGFCTGCWEPEYKAEDLDVSGTAPVQTGVSADGCIGHWQFPDDLELTVDFETMATPSDGFQLGEMAGHVGTAYIGPGGVSPGLFIRAGHDDLSKRSLLRMVNDRASGDVDLRWWSSGCLDVSTRRGIRFWAKGAGASGVRPRLPKAPPDGECVPQATIVLTEEWRMYEYTWDRFCPSGKDPAFAQRLTGMQFFIGDALVEPWIAIDDVSFID